MTADQLALDIPTSAITPPTGDTQIWVPVIRASTDAHRATGRLFDPHRTTACGLPIRPGCGAVLLAFYVEHHRLRPRWCPRCWTTA